MEKEIEEFEEEGGLAVSIVIWLLALAAPFAVLVVRSREHLRCACVFFIHRFCNFLVSCCADARVCFSVPLRSTCG